MIDPVSVTSSPNRLEAIGLAKSYRGREVVKSVSLHIKSGDIVGLLGPNGAGKTTCFYMIVGLIAGTIPVWHRASYALAK